MTVPEPTVDETYQILLGLRERYEAHHKLRYTDESLMSAAKYSSQYISDRFLPDKVIHADGLGPVLQSSARHCMYIHVCMMALTWLQVGYQHVITVAPRADTFYSLC